MDRTAPNCQLRLEWVYGYRGHQVRSNLYYNDSNEAIYFVAGVSIVHNHALRKQRFFLGHDDDIISLTMHPDNVHVATGQVGKSPQILVWNSKTLETKSILKDGHTDGVGIVTFDKSGERLASCGIDQDSTIAVWDWKKGKLLAKSTGHQEKVFDLQFNPFKENSLVSCGVKQISFLVLTGNTLQKKKGLFGKTKDIQTMFCLAFSTKSKEVYYTGTMSGQIYVWKENQLEEILPNVHKGAIYTISTLTDGFVTGGKDGKIRTWDSSFSPLQTIDVNKLVSDSIREHFINDEFVIRSLHCKNNSILIGTQTSEIFEIDTKNLSNIQCICRGHAEGELWALDVSPVNNDVFATASDDQTVRVWNMKNGHMMKIAELEKKIRSCSFSMDGQMLACGLSDGTLVVLKIQDMSVAFKQKPRSEVLHEMKYSPCGKYLAVGSNENYVDVYVTTPAYKKIGTCSGNSSFITHLDWSKDSQYIQTNSGDGARLIYKIPTCKQFTTTAEIEKIEWNSFTGVLGTEVVGIWEKYANKTDVNASDANFKEKCIVTGDGSKFRKYVGHSSHVTNVRFTKDKSRVLSIGGADHAIFQWRFMPEEQTASAVGKSSDATHVDDLPANYQAYMDSNSEDSDSELSGNEIDSDIENEKLITYDRPVYKDDLAALKPKIKEEIKKATSTLSAKRQARPDVSLELEFVFGYRGYDCRDNLFYIHESGEIVYHVAALGIVFNKETQTQRFYNQHNDDILCLALHPRNNFVATGQIGRDPPIHVWDIESMKTLSILKGEHYRGVCSLSFSSDGKKIASVGLDDNHSICVWDWKRGEKLATTRGHKDKIFCIKWNPHSTEKLVTVGVKHIKFWSQVGGGFTSNRGVFGKLSPVENMMCITFGKTEELCYTGGGNGSIYMWSQNNLARIIAAHTGPIFAIYAHEQWEAYVTGGKDGSIVLWNNQFAQIHKYTLDKKTLSSKSRGLFLCDQPSVRAISLAAKKILIGTKNGEVIDIDKDGVMNILVQGHGEGELWGLSCHPTRLEFCTCSDDKTLRVWKLEPKNMSLLRGKLFDKQCRHCQYSPNGKLIAVGFKEGGFCVLNSESLDVLETINHRTREISDMKFSPVTGKYLAVGSHEDLIDIYNIDAKKRVGICKGASSYITHVEWDVEGKLLMSNSGASEVLYFEAPRGARINMRTEDMVKLEWSTFTSVLGATCEGIWQPCMNVTDINSTCLSKDRRTLATADDFGLVKLFEYPAIGKFSKFKKYVGHSSHVTQVRWSVDDRKLISVGGNDTSILIWNNLAVIDHTAPTSDLAVGAKSAASTRSMQNDLVRRNANKGLSDDSETDSEDDGYDSDVKREHEIDYKKSINPNDMVRPSTELVQQMYKDVNMADKTESSKPSRLIKTKFKRTKINKIKGVPQSNQQKDVDPFTVLHVMAKLGALVEQNTDEITEEDNSIKMEISSLKLKHIHGYRGFDCRDNLFYINDGLSIVYHAAAAGVVYDLNQATQSFYLEHTDDIISLGVNENPKFKNVVATGQIGTTPTVHVWDALTKETLSVLSGLHKNSQGVCSLGFSSSGKLLVTVGLDKMYTVGVWRWKEGVLVASAAGDNAPNRIFRVMFRPDSDTVFVSVGFKHIRFWSVAGSMLIYKKGVLTDFDESGTVLKKMPTMLSIAFGQDNITYSGSMGGEIFIWKDNVLMRAIKGAHNGPIFSMYTSLFDGCIVTGAKEKESKDSGPIKLWDKDMKKALKVFNLDEPGISVVKSVCRIKNKILVGTKASNIFEIQEKTCAVQAMVNGHAEGELWALAVHPNRELFATASYEGFLKIWDIKTNKMISKHDMKKAIRCIHFSMDGLTIALGTKDGEIILLKVNTKFDQFERLDSIRQRKACITDIKFSPVKSYLVSGADDNSVDFYEISASFKLKRITYCTQVPGVVLQIDWSTTAQYIKVGTSNYKTVVYELPSGNQVMENDIHDKVEWQQWTSIFGEEVIGIWPQNSITNYINCAHLASHAMKLATGDDDGSIRLYKFPCIEANTTTEKYYGHSSNVTNIKFLFNAKHLISIGGDDFCVFVWECI